MGLPVRAALLALTTVSTLVAADGPPLHLDVVIDHFSLHEQVADFRDVTPSFTLVVLNSGGAAVRLHTLPSAQRTPPVRANDLPVATLSEGPVAGDALIALTAVLGAETSFVRIASDRHDEPVVELAPGMQARIPITLPPELIRSGETAELQIAITTADGPVYAPVFSVKR